MNMIGGEDQLEDDREKAGFISGLVLGVVTNNSDPEQLARVRVRLPWHDDGQESYWARLAMPMAMDSQGTFFLPEVDDEVLVGFDRGDPGHPYVIGSLWNGNASPPESNADNQNNWRVIKTRSDSELRFYDGSPPSVELKLADGKRLFMDDEGISLEDGNGNEFKIDSSGSGITIKATGELNIEGQQVSITAGGAMNIEASGTTTIKGALVQIN